MLAVGVVAPVVVVVVVGGWWVVPTYCLKGWCGDCDSNQYDKRGKKTLTNLANEDGGGLVPTYLAGTTASHLCTLPLSICVHGLYISANSALILLHI